MERIFDADPYQTEFDARVTACRPCKAGFEAELDRTAFYPEGGGQPADAGSLGGARVLDVQERGGRILHTLDRPLEKGACVHGIIDWERRFSHMQLHSGEHIASGIICRRFGYHNVGFHMGHEEVTVDFNGPLTWEQLMEAEREANRVIWQDLPVRVTYPSRRELETLDYRSKKEIDGPVRIVEIPQADCCACCGTHVRRTGEIGAVKFLSLMNYKGGVRAAMLCGMRALEDYERKTDEILELSSLLSAPAARLAQAVRRLKEENGQKDMAMAALYRRLFESLAEQIPESGPALALCEPNLPPAQLRFFCNCLMEKQKADLLLVCTGDDQTGYSYCAASRSADLRAPGKILNEKLDGRGGGSSQMIQGTFHAPWEKIRRCFYEICPEET